MKSGIRLTITRSTITIFIFLLIAALFPIDNAHALPTFARQTGMDCEECHTSHPELTATGRAFKISGYTQTLGDKSGEPNIPLSGGLKLSATIGNGITGGVAPFDSASNRPTDAFNIPQDAHVIFGGKIAGPLGAFIELTYSGVENNIALGMVDIRLASTTTLGDKNFVYGLTINNSPTLSDPWNTTPAWGYPYESSDVANRPAAMAVIDSMLSQQVGGAGIYAFWNRMIYAEFALYRTNYNGITYPLGLGTTVNNVAGGAIPYWRVVVEKQWENNTISLGTFGLITNIYPNTQTGGTTNNFTDWGLDAQYQYINKSHAVTAKAIYIHEEQFWNAAGAASNYNNNLNTFRVNGDYFYRSEGMDVGGVIGYFTTGGSSDSTLYISGSPNSSGFTIEADYSPCLHPLHTKFGILYTIYTQFNGMVSNASNNNTLYIFAHIMI